jgi:hypothetical protein
MIALTIGAAEHGLPSGKAYIKPSSIQTYDQTLELLPGMQVAL